MNVNSLRRFVARPKPCADGCFADLNSLTFAWTLLVPSRPWKDQCELSSRLWKDECFAASADRILSAAKMVHMPDVGSVSV